jgi:hypothetical protein
MNNRIELKVKNREIKKSLIYSLERKFINFNFVFDEIDHCLVVDHIDSTKEDNFEESFSNISIYISEYLAKLKRMDGKLKIETIFESKSHQVLTTANNSFQNEVHQTDVNGSFWIDRKLFKIYKILDSIFIHFANTVGANEVYAPSLISQEDLVTCGYLPKELHQVSFLFNKDRQDKLSGGHICLSPAACLTTYPVFRNKFIKTPSMAFTLLGNVFRHEGGRFSLPDHPFERMWEYQVRELIFFGNTEYKEIVKNKYFDFLKYLGKALNFSFDISSASDLFFHTEYSSALAHQLITKSKFEFVLLNHHRLALSSFNSHGDQFIKAFNISHEAYDFQTFCIGFGIQRFIQGIMLTHQDIDQAIAILDKIQKELETNE